MSSRTSYWLAVLFLCVAAVLRLWQLASLPPGLQASEIIDIRIADEISQGRIEVFYDLGAEGREGLYHTVLAAVTAVIGDGMIGYHVLSVWAGMLTLAVVYALVTRLYGPLPGAAAIGLLALGMFPILLSRIIAREVFVPLLVAGALLAIARAFPVYQQDRRTRPPTTIPFAALGLVLGLAFYTHPAAFALALFAVAFIVYMLLSRQPMGSRIINYTSFAVVLMIIIATPYLISTLRRPDLGGAERLLQAYAQSARPFLETLSAGITGIFVMGDANPLYNLPGRPLLDFISAFLLLVGIITAVRYWRLPRFALPIIAFVALTPSVLLAPNSPYFPSYSALLPLLALFFSLGVKTVYSGLARGVQRIGMIMLVALALFNLGWTARDLFGTWANLAEVRQAYNGDINALALYVDRTSDEIPTVLCAPTLNPYQIVPAANDRTQLLLEMMHRTDEHLRLVDCSSGLVLASGGEQQQIIIPDTSIVNNMPSSLRTWLDYGTVADVAGTAPGSIILLDVSSELADRLGVFGSTLPVTYDPGAANIAGAALLPVSLGGNITFLGYEPQSAQSFRPGSLVSVVTYWRIDGVVPPDILFFTHILADPASVDAQRDVISVRPDHLQPRDIVVQVTYIELPVTLRPGRYSISVGAYQNQDEQRMVVLDNGQPRGNRLFLDFIMVTE
jgi:hypothetical protein